MSQGPLTTRDIKRPKGADDLRALKRRLVSLARLDRDVVHLADGPVLVRIRRFRDIYAPIERLRAKGSLDRATLERSALLESPPLAVAPSLFAELQHDLGVVGSERMRAIAREHRRAIARYGDIDAAWLAEKGARLEALVRAPPPARWTDVVCELVRALRGEDEMAALERSFAALDTEPMDRRAKAFDRVLAIARALETGVPPAASDVNALYERLDAARDFPGRAKKRRTLDVLRRAIGWAELPAEMVGDRIDDFVEGARHAIARWPIVPNDESVARLASLALAFRLGTDGAPELADVETKDVAALAASDITLEQAAALAKIKMGAGSRTSIARLVANGLDLELVRTAEENKQLDALAELPDARAARAFATWTQRFADHYKKHGVKLTLPAALFTRLPKNEDLAVLTHCLLDQHAEPKSDPIRTLDETLGLFHRLPVEAKRLLDRLRRDPRGEGRRLDPAFAEWVDDDALLDRSIHVAELAGEPAISHAIREDFERAERRDGERAHLARLVERSLPQQRRLEALGETSDADAPRRARTIRRLRARVERLLPRAYRRELDRTFRSLLEEAWGIRLAELTPAWRDAVRFWLVVDENRDHLEALLRAAAEAPGRSVKDAFPKNRAWLESMKRRIDTAAWVAPRRIEVSAGDARFTIATEEDPLEVLRMGIPFGTCLALDGGSNAASTVLNAIEINKRVIYARNEDGKIVARKLIGMTDQGRLVGYHHYQAIGGDEARAIKAAIAGLCSDIAKASGAVLSDFGAPRKLHPGFWYDDGNAGFGLPSEDVLGDFCRAHGLSPPERSDDDDDTLRNEAEAWRSRVAEDIDGAVRVLKEYGDSPATRAHDDWTIEKLGLRAALKLADDAGAVGYALFRRLASDENGMLRALDLASRLPERSMQGRLAPLLARFPPSPKLGVALVDLAIRSMRTTQPYEHGLVHMTLFELPKQLEDVAGALDLLDGIEPAWRWLAEKRPSCRSCVDGAVTRAIAMIEEIYESSPDPDVVRTSLMSRRRSELAHRAVLHVAARHVIPDGRRALVRFSSLRPALMKTGDGLAALLRQSNGELSSAPVPEESPFEALRDLVALPDVHRFLGKWDSLAGDAKNTWEAAWRRRRRSDPAGGYDALWVEAARKKLVRADTPEAERAVARTVVLDAKDGEVVHWVRLVAACARVGDGETARRVLDEVLTATNPALAPRTLVDLWPLGPDVRAAIARSFVRQHDARWAARVLAAECEAKARGIDVSDMLEEIALAQASVTSPSDCVLPETTDQLRRVLAAVVRRAEPSHVSAVFVHLEDALSVMIFRDELAKQTPGRRAELLAEIRKRDLSSARTKTFFAWIQDFGAIETA